MMAKSSSFPLTMPGAIFAVAAALALLAGGAAAQTASWSGRVVDAGTGEGVPHADVLLEGTARVMITGSDGSFTFAGLPEGALTFQISHASYNVEFVRAPDGVGGLPTTVRLAPHVFRLREITVSPGAFSFMDGRPSARKTMSRAEMQLVPQLGEDVFRAVNRMPGLSSGDYNAHFSIRGGRHDETLILLDGLEIYEPYHLKDFNEGAISIIDVETIEGVQLLTGGFPAEYGNKRSGVFDIASRRPPADQKRYSVGISFMNARALAEGRFADNRGSWFVSGRRGYLDLVFKIVNQNDLPSPTYYDLFSKVQYDLNTSHTIALHALHAGDSYTFDAQATAGFQDSIKTQELANNTYGNSYVWTTLRSTFSDALIVRSLLSAGLVTRDRSGSEYFTEMPGELYSVSNKHDYNVLGAKQDWLFEPMPRLFFQAGIDCKRFTTDYTFRNSVSQHPEDSTPDSIGYFPVVTETNYNRDGTTLGLYFSNRVRPWDAFTLETGVRHDRASYTGDSDVSPRVNALLDLTPSSRVRLGWGIYRQIQGIQDLALLNGQEDYYSSEKSEQFTAGFEQLFANGATLRIEAYTKEGTDLRPVYRGWKGGIDVFPETNEDRILVYPDRTTGKGVEFYYDQRLSERVMMRGSYAYSLAEEEVSRIDNVNDPSELVYDRTHPNPQDQRHALNLDCTYRLSRNWSINTSYAFHTGWPGTLEELVPITNEEGQPDFTIRPIEIYGSRLPAYHRLDMRATKDFRTKHGDVRFFAELVNMTNHANVFGYDYFRLSEPGGGQKLVRDDEMWFTILPSLGVSLTSRF